MELDQKNYEYYGLPSAGDYPRELLDEAPKVLTGSKSLKDALKKVDEFLLRGQEWRQVGLLKKYRTANSPPQEGNSLPLRCMKYFFNSHILC